MSTGAGSREPVAPSLDKVGPQGQGGPAGEGPAEVTRPGQPPLSPARPVPRVAWEPGVPQTDPSAESPGPLPAGSLPGSPRECRPFTPRLLRSLPTPGSAGCTPGARRQTLWPRFRVVPGAGAAKPDSNQLGSGVGDAAPLPRQHTANTSWPRPPPLPTQGHSHQTTDPGHVPLTLVKFAVGAWTPGRGSLPGEWTAGRTASPDQAQSREQELWLPAPGPGQVMEQQDETPARGGGRERARAE